MHSEKVERIEQKIEEMGRIKKRLRKLEVMEMTNENVQEMKQLEKKRDIVVKEVLWELNNEGE